MSIKGPARAKQKQAAPTEPTAAPATKASEPEAAEPQVISLRAGSLAYTLVHKLRTLPYEKQQEVLDFVQFLAHRDLPKRPRRSLKGLWADLDIKVSDEDVAEARREMWGNFPREDV